MLLNGPKLIEYVGEPEAPVVLKCPRCDSVFSKPHKWEEMQERSVVVSCACGFDFPVPRFVATDYVPEERLPRLIRRPAQRTKKFPYGRVLTAVAISAVGAVVWHSRRRPSGSFEVIPSERDD